LPAPRWFKGNTHTHTPLEVLQKDVNLVHEAGAIAQINHPNFGWAWTGTELVQIENGNLLEIWNGHPLVNNLGGGGVPSAEAMWDQALTAGRRLFAVADDDAHHFKIERLADRAAAAPGRGWIFESNGKRAWTQPVFLPR
jgi:hypothetical protein